MAYNRRDQYPVTYLLSRKTLSALATEANSERVFNGAGHVMADLRTSMHANNFEAWVTVPENYELLKPTAAEIEAAWAALYGQEFLLAQGSELAFWPRTISTRSR